MDAEGATLAHDAVEQHRGVLGDAVLLGEVLLELVDHQQRARHRLLAAAAFVAGDVLGTELAEQVAATSEFVVDALQDAEAELAVGLDRDDAGVRQLPGGVGFELDAFFKVDEVELDLVRAAREREVGDDDVEQGGLAGTGLAGEQGVLAGTFADREVLQLGRASAADGDAQLVGGLVFPVVGGIGGDVGERDFDTVRVGAGFADLVDEADGELAAGRVLEAQAGALSRAVRQVELALFVRADADAVFDEFVGDELVG